MMDRHREIRKAAVERFRQYNMVASVMMGNRDIGDQDLSVGIEKDEVISTPGGELIVETRRKEFVRHIKVKRLYNAYGGTTRSLKDTPDPLQSDPSEPLSFSRFVGLVQTKNEGNFMVLSINVDAHTIEHQLKIGSDYWGSVVGKFYQIYLKKFAENQQKSQVNVCKASKIMDYDTFLTEIQEDVDKEEGRLEGLWIDIDVARIGIQYDYNLSITENRKRLYKRYVEEMGNQTEKSESSEPEERSLNTIWKDLIVEKMEERKETWEDIVDFNQITYCGCKIGEYPIWDVYTDKYRYYPYQDGQGEWVVNSCMRWG